LFAELHSIIDSKCYRGFSPRRGQIRRAIIVFPAFARFDIYFNAACTHVHVFWHVRVAEGIRNMIMYRAIRLY